MKKFAKFIANHSVLILVISFLLLVPAIYGYVNTRINYDILVYLPDSVDTIKGENILTDDFGLGAYAFVMVDSSNNKKMLDLEKDIKHKRFDRLKQLVESQISERNKEYVGTVQKILVEGRSKTNDNMLTGRSDSNKVVILEGCDELVGKMVEIKIVSEHMWYLKGEIV